MRHEGLDAAHLYLRWARDFESRALDDERNNRPLHARKARFTAKVLRHAAKIEMTDPEVLDARRQG